MQQKLSSDQNASRPRLWNANNKAFYRFRELAPQAYSKSVIFACFGCASKHSRLSQSRKEAPLKMQRNHIPLQIWADSVRDSRNNSMFFSKTCQNAGETQLANRARFFFYFCCFLNAALQKYMHFNNIQDLAFRSGFGGQKALIE